MSKTSDVVFFLGAGASVPAGVPDARTFVKEFRKSVKDTEKLATIEQIIEILEKWNREKEVDIELLLKTLMKLDSRKKEPLLHFYKNIDKNFILMRCYSLKDIINALKNFIKSKTIVKSERIKYLEPIKHFGFPLDIISVNYDNCIEQFCSVYGLTCQDGFDTCWNPKVFDYENTNIRLYKLHGSVMWYKTDKRRYIKSEILQEGSKTQLTTGETAKTLMLYPIQKWVYSEPYLELLVRAKHLLGEKNVKFLIVAGYSFRDEYIREMLWDIARENSSLKVILIDPHACCIYSEKLRYYDIREKIPTSLDGRVVYLPYAFEKVLPELKNYYLKNLSLAINDEKKGKEAKLCLKSLIEAEYTDKADRILKEKINTSEFEKSGLTCIETYFKMFINFIATHQVEKAYEYQKKSTRSLRKALIETMEIELTSYPDEQEYIIEVRFNSEKTDGGIFSFGADQLKSLMENLIKFIKKRESLLTKTFEEFECSKKAIDAIKNYLITDINGGKIKSSNYLKVRKNYIKKYDEFIQDHKNYCNLCTHEAKRWGKMTMDDQKTTEAAIKGIREQLIKTIKETESNILQGFINKFENFNINRQSS